MLWDRRHFVYRMYFCGHLVCRPATIYRSIDDVSDKANGVSDGGCGVSEGAVGCQKGLWGARKGFGVLEGAVDVDVI